jgi:hypothetical protein
VSNEKDFVSGPGKRFYQEKKNFLPVLIDEYQTLPLLENFQWKWFLPLKIALYFAMLSPKRDVETFVCVNLEFVIKHVRGHNCSNWSLLALFIISSKFNASKRRFLEEARE